MKLCVVVPAFNEADNLIDVVPAIIKVVRDIDDGGRLLVVDDGSADGTREVLAELCDEHDGVNSLAMGRNVGKAAALQRGFEVALDMGAETIAMMDADGQDDPAEMGRLIDTLMAGSDLVTGARITRNDRFMKRGTSRLYNAVTGRISGAPGRDFNSGFKVMRSGVARDVAPMMYGELHRYLTVIAHAQGYRVAELPVEHHPRLFGASKYGVARFWRGFYDLLTIRFLLSYQHRPSHLFGGLGFLGLISGTLVLAYMTLERVAGNSIGDRPLLIAGVLLFLSGLQLVIFGLLAELVVHARNTRSPAART